MRFCIEKVSDPSFYAEREINTIEDLKELESIHPGWHNDGFQKDFIVSFAVGENGVNSVVIYDDWYE